MTITAGPKQRCETGDASIPAIIWDCLIRRLRLFRILLKINTDDVDQER